MRHWKYTISIVLIIIGLALISCESNMESDYSPPDDHTLSKDGIMHKTGLNSAESNCTSCHGDDLRGGTTDVSCYECHGKKW